MYILSENSSKRCAHTQKVHQVVGAEVCVLCALLCLGGNGPHGEFWNLTAPKKTQTLLLSRLTPVLKIHHVHLCFSHGKIQAGVHGPRLLPSEGMSALCVVNERAKLSVFSCLTSAS